MAAEPFPSTALAENRERHLTAEQLRDLHIDAKASKRSSGQAGIWLLAVGVLLLAGTIMGRVPGSKVQSLLVGASIAGVGVLMLSQGGRTSGVQGEQVANESTVLDVIEGPIRRQLDDKQVGMDLVGATRNIRGDARYNFYLHVGERRFDVGRPAFEAAPEDGIVRVYLLPGTDRIVNLERIADAPQTAVETHARELLEQRFGAVSDADHQAIASHAPPTAEALRKMLIGHWQAEGISMAMEFRADGRVGSGRDDDDKRWEVTDASHNRIGDQVQSVATDGTTLLFGTRGPTLRFHRVVNDADANT